ncbi:MAG: PIN domain-containing protein [Caldilineaceae bacterium]|nr:PIN domain-containing protein [Caldilineaceae bacterium]MCB0123300.1 PIN domain-containing protein [Caldilineaceae bacterium]
MTVRIFADTNILIAGADSRSGASRAVLLMAEIGLFRLVVSRQVLDEAERNIRTKLPRALPNFAEQMVYLNLEIQPDPPTAEVAQWESVIELKDAPILAAAIGAKVDRILSLNTRDFTQEVAAACGIPIQTPAQFVQNIRAIIDLGI